MAEIQSLKSNNNKEWDMLVIKYSKNIYNIALNFTKNRDEAADITQDIFIKVYQNIQKYKDQYCFSAWLFRVAKNYCIDYWRKNKKFKDSYELNENIHVSPHFNPEEESIKHSEVTLLRKKIKTLPPDIRILIVLRDIQGYSYEKIQSEVDLPLGTIKSRINRGRLKLAKIFNDEEKK